MDYETQSQYILIVEAIDSPIDRRTGTATVTINVIDVQDEIPIFVQVTVSTTVNENANLGTVVAAVTVSIFHSICLSLILILSYFFWLFDTESWVTELAISEPISRTADKVGA